MFFKRYRKKIGVCLALLAMVFCTFFGINKLDPKKDVTAKADQVEDYINPDMFTQTFVEGCSNNVNLFPSYDFKYMSDSESEIYWNEYYSYGGMCFKTLDISGDEDIYIYSCILDGHLGYDYPFIVGQEYTLVVRQLNVTASDNGGYFKTIIYDGTHYIEGVTSPTRDTYTITFTLPTHANYLSFYIVPKQGDRSGGITVQFGLYKGSTSYGVGIPLQSIVDSAYHNGQQAGGGSGSGYTQSQLDSACQESYNSGYNEGFDIGYNAGYEMAEKENAGDIDVDSIRQEGYNAGYQAGIAVNGVTSEELLQAEYERGYQAGIDSINQDTIRQEGYEEGYQAGLEENSGIDQNILKAEYDKGFLAGKESVDLDTVRQESYEDGYSDGISEAAGQTDYGVFIGSTWTYMLYDEKSRPPYYLSHEFSFSDIVKEEGKLFFNSPNLSTVLNSLDMAYWTRTEVIINFAVPVIKGGFILGFDTAQLPVHFKIAANGHAVKLVDNDESLQIGSRYLLDFSNVPEGTFIDTLTITMISNQGTKDKDWVFGSTALVTDINFYSLGYNDGYKDGEGSGYEEGYDKGNEQGYEMGYKEGDKVGYNRGYNTGVADVNATSEGFFNLMTSIVDAPVQVFTSLLDFEILGYNMKKFALSILTACLLVAVVKFFSGIGAGGN